jgi:hypothetical protein
VAPFLVTSCTVYLHAGIKNGGPCMSLRIGCGEMGGNGFVQRAVELVPHTGAIRASTCRRAQQPLRGSQLEYAWQHPPTALSAQRKSV